MPPVPQPAVFSALHFGRGLIFPVLIAASVLVIVVPLPPFVLDLL